jgi:branched-chain amino acid transport system substrate-binding protein
MNSVSQSIPAVIDPAVQQGGKDAAANMVTVIYIKDPGDPQWASDKAIQDYLAFMKKYYPDGNPLDGFNVYGYSVAQTLIDTLTRAGNNLTRENVMKQATSIKDLRIDTLLPGILINTSETDYYPIQSEQLAKYNPDAKKWDLIGEVIDVGGK